MKPLDYSPRWSDQERREAARGCSRASLTAFLGLLLAGVHLMFYTRLVAYWLWEWMGGIRSQGLWTSMGADWAPTVPMHLPAGMLFWLGGAGHDEAGKFSHIAILLILVGSLVAGMWAAAFLPGLLWRDKRRLGKYYWRLWAFLAGWGWIVVPQKLSWIYQWTVAY